MAANKTSTGFLPFITDASGHLTVFRSLVQRSKGLSNAEVFSIFCAIAKEGYSSVCGAFPNESKGVLEDFKNLAARYMGYSIPSFQTECFDSAIRMWGTEQFSPQLLDTNQYVPLFIAACSYCNVDITYLVGDFPSEYFFDAVKENPDIVLGTLKNTKIVSDGDKVGFLNYSELCSYLILREFKEEGVKEITPIIIFRSQKSTPSSEFLRPFQAL